MESNSGEISCDNSTERHKSIEEEEEQEEEEGEEILKRRILGHPLYSLLVETHINCLKVGIGANVDDDKGNATKKAKLMLETHKPSTSDLDLFMEAYYLILKKLKEAMEEPLEGATSFINDMYKQLREMNENHTENSKPDSSA
ncbi:protein KNATM [Jatropha curcas]|uniref:protein KNATM n=1 Tax=Jatropha curcas TaxID=180498 RepID=UPI0005FBF3DD|nr:protein KNATM [Jatropha curcas]